MGESLYLEDLHVGRRFTSRAVTLDQDRIETFAREFDPQPFHLDEAAARASVFGGLVASGWHTACVSMRLMVESVPLANGLIGFGVEVSWPRPTRPGDTLRVESEVLEVVPSRSKPDRGTVTARSTTLNQHGEAVCVVVARMMAFRRPLA